LRISRLKDIAILVGCTGFVGGHLARQFDFTHRVHRSDLASIAGIHTDLLVCAGLPAEKWRANRDPGSDWANMAVLAQVLTSVRAERAVLISTIDVYQPPMNVDETTAPQFNGVSAYGSHRCWFETFFQARFVNAMIIRLPGLFAPDVRKNLIHDLIHGKADQWAEVNPASSFQFFDASRTWNMIQRTWHEGISLLNITSEPVTAQEVADLFGVSLTAQSAPVAYDTRSIHAEALGGHDGYIFTRESILDGIAALRKAWQP
jgi:nucleoside-diphosphate-sugar epimerase